MHLQILNVPTGRYLQILNVPTGRYLQIEEGDETKGYSMSERIDTGLSDIASLTVSAIEARHLRRAERIERAIEQLKGE